MNFFEAPDEGRVRSSIAPCSVEVVEFESIVYGDRGKGWIDVVIKTVDQVPNLKEKDGKQRLRDNFSLSDKVKGPIGARGFFSTLAKNIGKLDEYQEMLADLTSNEEFAAALFDFFDDEYVVLTSGKEKIWNKDGEDILVVESRINRRPSMKLNTEENIKEFKDFLEKKADELLEKLPQTDSPTETPKVSDPVEKQEAQDLPF